MQKIILILIFLLISIVLFAQKHMSKDNMHKERMYMLGLGPLMNEKFLTKIGIKEEDRLKIREIIQNLKIDLIDLQSQYQEKKITMHKEIIKNSLDETKIQTIIKELAEIRKEQQLKIELKKFEILKLLPLEQRKALINEIAKLREHFWKNMQDRQKLDNTQ